MTRPAVLLDSAEKEHLVLRTGPPNEPPNWCCELLLLSLPNASGDVSVPLAVLVECRAVIIVGAGFGDDVQITGIRAADLSRCTVEHHLELPHRKLREKNADSLGPPPRGPPWSGSLKSTPSMEIFELIDRWPLTTIPKRFDSCVTLGDN
jgi:hypothetical protein